MNKPCIRVDSSCSFQNFCASRNSGAPRFLASICNQPFPPQRTAGAGGATYCVSARDALTLAQTDTKTAGRPGGTGTRVRSRAETPGLQPESVPSYVPLPSSWHSVLLSAPTPRGVGLGSKLTPADDDEDPQVALVGEEGHEDQAVQVETFHQDPVVVGGQKIEEERHHHLAADLRAERCPRQTLP